MTSYGDPHAGDYDDGYQPPSPGRAQVPQPSYDAYGYPQEGYPPNGNHSDGGGYSPDPAYAAPVAAGRASVPVASGRASVPVVTGRATVPVSPAGRAAVPVSPAGRAVVRPPASPDEDEDGYDRPKRTPSKKKKNARRQKIFIAAIGVLILLTGGGMIGASYYYDKIPSPGELTLFNSTEVLAANNKLIAKLGDERRSEVAMAALKPEIKNTLIAGEDKNFYDHQGVDLWGIARAAWNNLTGGETQGASTITQQYARLAANKYDMTYGRKVREAIMARKLENEYSKEDILGFYLNSVYFGRGAHGIGAAAEIYFGIPPDKIGDDKVGLTVAQAAVLGAVLKQPEGKNSFDPAVNPEAAKDRWAYVLNNMVEVNWLPADERAKQQYPEVQPPKEESGAAIGYTDSGTGYVINYVGKELLEKGILAKDAKGAFVLKGTAVNWKNSGLRITTTIQPNIQAALEAQLNRADPNSTLNKNKLRDHILGAGVAIEPKTGRVLAYYGGTNNGTGTDYAGMGQPHPPASSFKIYTLAAALAEGYSINSLWNPTKLTKKKDGYDLDNANREGDPTCLTYCSLEENTIKSFNVPFFDIARKIQPKKIVEMAHKAGVRTMWTTDPFQPHDLSKPIENRNPFDYWAGIGQYPITVLDHASGTATFANHGVYQKPHFVVKVERKNKDSGEWERIPTGDEKLDKGVQAIPKNIADEVTSVLKKIPVGGQYGLKNGYEAAGKTGTWENGAKTSPTKYKYPGTNAHVWFTGYTAQVATAIWVGDKDENKTPIKMNTGKKDLLDEDDITSSYPKRLWKLYMDQVNASMKYGKERLTPGHTPGRVGRADKEGTGISPTPSPPSCIFPFQPLCPSPPGGPGNRGGGGGGGRGGGDGPPDDD